MNYFNKSSQEVNKVYRTNDLSVFNQLKGNRIPSPQHIRRLCASINTHGILQNPIIVNENMDVIDGQHRLLAAKEAKSSVFYIIVSGYNLEEVQILNLNQKNWTKRDFLEGYADMGIESYLKLKSFVRSNSDFNITDCIAMCQNSSSSSSTSLSNKHRHKKPDSKQKEVFEEGTWIGRDFKLAQEWADKLKMIKPYYNGYRRSTFVGAMISLFKRANFDFFEFFNKLKIQPHKLDDCSNVSQYRLLIEDIYNYRRRDKVNLRF